jgi:DNA polymerase-3 subunit epsilon
MNFVAFDFETANESRNSACAIGFVLVEEGDIKERYYSLIKPPDNRFSPVNVKIHGITPQETLHAPTFIDIWPIINKTFYNNLIVAHNIAFDLAVLKNSLQFYGLQDYDFKHDCTYNIYGDNLATVASAFEIEFAHHNALHDAEVCAQIYLKHLNQENPDYSKVPTYLKNREFFGLGWHKALKGDVLKPNFNVEDQTSPFFQKKVVITGLFRTITREEIARKLKLLGADVDTSVTQKTNYIIVGLDPGPSKINKANDLIKLGSPLKMLTEIDFISIANIQNVHNH